MKKTGKKPGKKERKGAKKKKKNSEPEMSWKEAVLAYQINIKEKALEDVKYELKIIEDENQRHKERNKELKAEQNLLMNDLVKSARNLDLTQTQITKDEVIAKMKNNWDKCSQNTQALEELSCTLAENTEEIKVQQHLIEYWKDYRDREQHEYSKQIILMQEAVVDMQSTFEIMSGYMTRSLTKEKEEIDRNMTEVLAQQKYLATEKAVAKMDKYSRREVIDNDWLSREIETHRREAAELYEAMEKLEEENLQILSQLFQCQMEDLRISRSFFMTQFLGSDDRLEENPILEVDLSKLKAEGKDSGRTARPKSAIQKAVEEKVFALHKLQSSCNQNVYSHNEDIDGHEGSDGDDDAFVKYLNLEDSLEDFLQLGPLETKILNVTGEKMNINKTRSASKDELEAKLCHLNEWPVTRPMLMDVLQFTSSSSSALDSPDSRSLLSK